MFYKTLKMNNGSDGRNVKKIAAYLNYFNFFSPSDFF